MVGCSVFGGKTSTSMLACCGFRQAVQRLAGVPGLVTGPPKSSRSRRTIPLPEITVETLRRHREAQAGEPVKAGTREGGSGVAFTSSVGTVLEPRNVSRLFDELQLRTAWIGFSVRTDARCRRVVADPRLLAAGRQTFVSQSERPPNRELAACRISRWPDV